MTVTVATGVHARLRWCPCAGTSPNCGGWNRPPPSVEIEAAARQYVRKVSGITRPTDANVEAFETAVAEVTAATTRRLGRAACAAPTAQNGAAAAPPEVQARIAARGP